MMEFHVTSTTLVIASLETRAKFEGKSYNVNSGDSIVVL
jgi:hypothetical protein